MEPHHHSQPCCLWDSYKFAWYSKFREPPLYRYAAQGDWDLIPGRCRSHPKEARFVHQYAPGDTPLGRLLKTPGCTRSTTTSSSSSSSSSSSCPPDVRRNILRLKVDAVRALLDANADAATVRDTFQRTPLHWACMDVVDNYDDLGDRDDGDGDDDDEDKDNRSILGMLLQRAPSAASMRDIEQRTPLHYLVARNEDIPIRLVAKIVAKHPEALTWTDLTGDTPMAIVQSRRKEIKDADALLRSFRKLETIYATPCHGDPKHRNQEE